MYLRLATNGCNVDGSSPDSGLLHTSRVLSRTVHVADHGESATMVCCYFVHRNVRFMLISQHMRQYSGSSRHSSPKRCVDQIHRKRAGEGVVGQIKRPARTQCIIRQCRLIQAYFRDCQGVSQLLRLGNRARTKESVAAQDPSVRIQTLDFLPGKYPCRATTV